MRQVRLNTPFMLESWFPENGPEFGTGTRRNDRPWRQHEQIRSNSKIFSKREGRCLKAHKMETFYSYSSEPHVK